MSYMTKDQLENYLDSLPSKTNKENKLGQLKSELMYPMQQLSVNDQDEQEEATFDSIQERMKRLRNATGTVLNTTHTQTPVFPETPKPQKPSFTSHHASSSIQPDAFEASLNPKSRRQPIYQQEQKLQQPIASPPPPPPPPPPMRQDNVTTITSPPAVPSSPRPPKPNSTSHKDTMVRTLNPIYAGLTCPGCQNPIEGAVVSAMNQIWHVYCFTCTMCQKSLESEKYYEKDDKPYCGEDYRRLFSLHCDFCHEPIVDSAISALGKHYHEGHFCCTVCKKPFGDHGAFMVHEGKPYCKDDLQKLCGKKCSGCKQYISGEYINALDQEWHKSCFVCTDCKRPFTNGTFMVKGNMPYCEEHYHHPYRPQQTPPPSTQQQQRPIQERKPTTLKPNPPVIAKKPVISSKPTTTSSQIDATSSGGGKRQSELNTQSSSSIKNNSKKTTFSAKGPNNKKICHRCNTMIDGSITTVLGYDYHIHHFQCSQCDRALSSRVPGMWQGDESNEIICKTCALKK